MRFANSVGLLLVVGMYVAAVVCHKMQRHLMHVLAVQACPVKVTIQSNLTCKSLGTRFLVRGAVHLQLRVFRRRET